MNRTALAVVLATVAMLFAGFTAAYVVRRTGADWQGVPLPGVLWASTAILAASSLALERARRRASREALEASLALGLGFLALQAEACRELAASGAYDLSMPHAAFFYTLSAIHGLHLAAGLVALAWARRRPESLGPVAVYWHFLGGVWVWVYALLASG
ncbi:MAG: cytochrome c oxidase subunit 3 [Planctomycetes bacterium]|nr:cytochrome c oxidase subunit 3 [Planctomycetota bacterium]